MRAQTRRTKEVFVPLSHRRGHAQVDFGETLGVIGSVECKIHFFVMSLPHCDAVFVKGYLTEPPEAFCPSRQHPADAPAGQWWCGFWVTVPVSDRRLISTKHGRLISNGSVAKFCRLGKTAGLC
jgi:hypothetical protein